MIGGGVLKSDGKKFYDECFISLLLDRGIKNCVVNRLANLIFNPEARVAWKSGVWDEMCCFDSYKYVNDGVCSTIIYLTPLFLAIQMLNKLASLRQSV